MGNRAARLGVLGVLAGLAAVLLRLFPRMVERGRMGSAPTAAQAAADARLTSADADSDAPSADQVFVESARRLLDIQVSSNDVLDTRIAGALGVGSTVLPVTIGLLNLLADAGSAPSVCAKRYLVAALAAYGLLLACATISFFIRKLDFRPNIKDTARYRAEGWDGAELRPWVANQYVDAVDRNRGPLVRKGWLALAGEATALSLAAFVTLR